MEEVQAVITEYAGYPRRYLCYRVLFLSSWSGILMAGSVVIFYEGQIGPRSRSTRRKGIYVNTTHHNMFSGERLYSTPPEDQLELETGVSQQQH